MMLFKIFTFKNEINIQQKNSTFNISSVFSKKINIQFDDYSTTTHWLFKNNSAAVQRQFNGYSTTIQRLFNGNSTTAYTGSFAASFSLR